MPSTTLEERVAKIEAELVQVKEQLSTTQSLNGVPWWKKFVGVYKNDPVCRGTRGCSE